MITRILRLPRRAVVRFTGLIFTGLSGLLVQAAVQAAVPTPKVEAVPGTSSLVLGNFPLSSVGYMESEYFFSGRATAYGNASNPRANGHWSVTPASTARYKSRFIVVTPKDPSKFSGTVVFEWLNESAGQDGPAEWAFSHDEIIRSGHIYVGVSAQALGVKQVASADPDRYGSLSHPGDSYSYDIFSQAGKALRADASKIIPGFQPTTFIATGESQSAIYLTTYIDAIAPKAKVYDAYLVHSRAAASAPLSRYPEPYVPAPYNLQIRTDLKVPVLTFMTETDVLGIPLLAGYDITKQPDSKYVRLWEVAGTAHADTYVTTISQDDDGSIAGDQALFASLTSPPSSISLAGMSINCSAPFNAGHHHYVIQTALRALDTWAKTGVAPPSMPRFQVTKGFKPSFVLDDNGNVVGGIRTPAVDAPLAVLTGLPLKGGSSPFCILFGQTTPFTPDQINALYPTHADFVDQWHQAVSKDLAAGSLLPEDAQRLDAVVQ